MLIVASDVVNRNDTGHLHEMAKAAKEVLDVETLQAAADTAYYNSEDLKACEDDGIVAYVPLHEGNGKLEKEGRVSRKDFSYDASADAYRCPAGELLRPTEGRWKNASGRVEIRYLGRKAACAACPLRAQCLAPKASYRSIARWEHEDVLERHRTRMESDEAAKLMRRRSAIVEHPFGTLKCRAGYRHFLVRGFAKVRGEWSLMALCYNFSRVLSILGFDRWLAVLAMRTRNPRGMLFLALATVPRRLSRFAAAICRAFHAVPAAQLRDASASQRTSCTFLPSLAAHSAILRERRN